MKRSPLKDGRVFADKPFAQRYVYAISKWSNSRKFEVVILRWTSR
jgi:hypothetical protein